MVTLGQVVTFRHKGWNFKNISVLKSSSEANNRWSPDLLPLRTTQNVLLLLSQGPATAASLGPEASNTHHISFIYVLILYPRLFVDFHIGLFLLSGLPAMVSIFPHACYSHHFCFFIDALIPVMFVELCQLWRSSGLPARVSIFPPCVIQAPLLSLQWWAYPSNVCRTLPVIKIFSLIWTCIFLHSPVNADRTTAQTTTHKSGLAILHKSGSLKVLLSVDLARFTLRHTSQNHVKVSLLFNTTNLTVKTQICCSTKHNL